MALFSSSMLLCGLPLGSCIFLSRSILSRQSLHKTCPIPFFKVFSMLSLYRGSLFAISIQCFFSLDVFCLADFEHLSPFLTHPYQLSNCGPRRYMYALRKSMCCSLWPVIFVCFSAVQCARRTWRLWRTTDAYADGYRTVF